MPSFLIAADFQLLVQLAARDGWTDSTPVPPTVFETDAASDPHALWRERMVEIDAEAPPPARRQAERAEDEVLRKQYPGEYVAYTDSWEYPTLRREVLAHDRSIGVVHAALARLTETELNAVRVTRCDDPARWAGFRGPTRLRLVARKDTKPRPDTTTS